MEFISLENMNAKGIYFLGFPLGFGGNYIGESQPWITILAPCFQVGLTLCENHFSCLNLSFVVCDLGMVIVLTSQSICVD